MRLSILIPAFHEEKTIAEVLGRVASVDTLALGFEKEIIVCDDGSSDGTVREIERACEEHAGIKLVRHPQNRGKGAAIRTALEHATGDYVLIQDADLEYEVSDYPAMIEAVKKGADAVYGSRFLSRSYPKGMHPANFLANKILTVAANVLYNHEITDEATCFKVVRTEVLRSLGLTCERFEFCPEVTAKLGLKGVKIVEVPIAYQARDVKDGKKVRWTDGVQALWVLLKHRLNPPA
ncbi:MAG: glycosyltransferase family 2 protein [Deltaproteobacteria bacterium]|nr:glycosyltransferase family 2 protein [Deltaproteobacteria bacterium]